MQYAVYRENPCDTENPVKEKNNGLLCQISGIPTGKRHQTDVLGTVIFNKDYLGEHQGVCAIPGPFADAQGWSEQI